MSVPFLIIDGYNLLHAAGLARLKYGPRDLERARHRLVARLAEKLSADERRHCTVVFDAQRGPVDVPHQGQQWGITVWFAPPGDDADSEIERLIARHPACQRLIVISGDHRLRQAAKRRGASSVDSETFLDNLDRRPSISPLKDETAKPCESPPQRQFPDDWQSTFGEIDVRELEAEVRREQPLPTDADPDWAATLQRQLDDPNWLEQWLDAPRPA
jgi:hypothetical protein